MKASFALALGVAIALAAGHNSANATEEAVKPAHSYHHRHNVHPRVPAARIPAARPTVEPAQAAASPAARPLIRNDSDGLSRDPEECNFGCLDNTQ